MNPGDTYVTVEWPDSYRLEELPKMFASMEVADRWIRAALLYSLGEAHDWVLTEPHMIRRFPPQITCDETEHGREYTGRTRTVGARAVPVKEAAFTASGERFEVVTGHKPGRTLTEGRRLTVFANVCQWMPPRIVGEAVDLPTFLADG